MPSLYRQVLINCIHSYARLNTNPVLSLLPDMADFEFDRKYPLDKFQFDGKSLKAYYHCHKAENRPVNEHGHFHIFLKLKNQQWSHLAALSMDKLGQPFQWFTVNHWVTGEAWGSQHELIQAIHEVENQDNFLLTENWLIAMMKFYMPLFPGLLQERDRELLRLNIEQTEELTNRQNRAIYTLSNINISLLDDLSIDKQIDSSCA